MTGHSHRLRTALAFLLATSLTACGQRGPLYIPDEGRAELPPEHPSELPANPETGTLPRDALEDTAPPGSPDEVFTDDFDTQHDEAQGEGEGESEGEIEDQNDRRHR